MDGSRVFSVHTSACSAAPHGGAVARLMDGAPVTLRLLRVTPMSKNHRFERTYFRIHRMPLLGGFYACVSAGQRELKIAIRASLKIGRTKR